MEVPQGLPGVLRKWKGVSAEILALFSTAVPNALETNELNLALLQPDRPESKAVIESYRTRYGGMINDRLQPAYKTIGEMDQEIERLLAVLSESGRSIVLPRSNILELCVRLAGQLSDLRDLATFGESDG